LAILGLSAFLVTPTLPGYAFLPDVSSRVVLPGGVQVPASLVHEAVVLANATLVLNDGEFIERGSYRPLTVVSPAVTSSNWIGYAWAKAECVYDPSRGYPVCEPRYKAFTGYWNIPSSPSDPDQVLLYIFNGMQPSGASSLPLLQPVLQWGDNGAFGGWYWSMASWYIYLDSSGNTQYVHSTPVTDSSSIYTDAHGGIGWIFDTTWDITSTFLNSDCQAGYYVCPDTTLTVDTGSNTLGYISVVLEGYWHNGLDWGYLDNCNQLPGDIHFTGLKVVDEDGYLKPAGMEGAAENTICPGFEVNILDGYSVDIITG
jgi:hypothetical protein